MNSLIEVFDVDLYSLVFDGPRFNGLSYVVERLDQVVKNFYGRRSGSQRIH